MTDESTEGVLRVLETRRPKSPTQFHVVVAVYGAILGLGATASLLAGDGQGAVGAVIVLGALFVGAEHRDRLFPNETGLSGSIGVALAASMYFGLRGWGGGAFLVCIAGGLYLPHIRRREFAKIAVNAEALRRHRLDLFLHRALFGPQKTDDSTGHLGTPEIRA